MGTKPEYELDNSVIPVHYGLSIDLNSTDDIYEGKVEIDVVFNKEKEEISLDCDGLDIKGVSFNGKKANYSINNKELKIKGYKIENENKVTVLFSGQVTSKMEGFYVSKYGKGKKMYSTHFEPTDARKAFPCFDHPALKATFDIDITADERYTILSNMSVKNEIIKGGRKKCIFNRMKKSSTYLIAFVIGDLQKITSGRISVYSTYDVGQGMYALRVADQSLRFFEEYFGIQYPLDKLDMVAIPEFAMGAMENWGLITYRETSLLFNKEKSSMIQRRVIAETVAHEIAHQWFGNLVTPKWWGDLWLNEGFATWAASLACNAIRDVEINRGNNQDNNLVDNSVANNQLIDWEPWTTFINDDVNRGMELDMLITSHPIKVPVYDPAEIGQIFDGISYSKSASLIRMIENYMGSDKFREKLGRYLKEYSYSNASSDDLFEFLSDENKDIARIMRVWTTKTGFPLVTLNDNKLVETRMVLSNYSDALTSWPVPIRMKIKNDVVMVPFEREYDISVLLQEKNAEMKDVFLNEGGYGFYRSFYDFDNNMAEQVAAMDTVNRLVHVNDQIALSKAQHIGLNRVMELFQTLSDEDNYEVLSPVIAYLCELEHIFYGRNEGFSAFLVNMTRARLNFDLKEEADMNTMALRALVLSTAVNHDVNVEMDDNIHPMYIASYFVQKMRQTNDLKYFLEMYGNSTAEVRVKIVAAIGKTTDMGTYKDVMSLMVSDVIKKHEKIHLSASLMSNLYFKDMFISFFIENFEGIRDAMNDSLMMYVVEQVISWSRDIDSVKRSMKAYNMNNYSQAYARALERAKYRIDFREKN